MSDDPTKFPIPSWPGPDHEFPTRMEWLIAKLAAGEPDVAVRDGENDTPLESAHGNHRARSADFIGGLHGSFSAIVRIAKSGVHIGSGCFVRAADLGFDFEEDVVLTAGHVVCDPDKEGATPGLVSKRPELMRVHCDERWPRSSFHCEVLWQSPIPMLDACVLRLKPAPVYVPRYDFEVPVLPIARQEPDLHLPLETGGGRRNQRLFLLSYPSGAGASATIEDNIFEGAHQRSGTTFPTFLRYNCPTAKGSSGGAILNEALELVGVHRAGAVTLHDGVTKDKSVAGVNEGVSIQSIRQAIVRSPAARIQAQRKPFFARLMSAFEPERTR